MAKKHGITIANAQKTRSYFGITSKKLGIIIVNAQQHGFTMVLHPDNMVLSQHMSKNMVCHGAAFK